MNKKQSAASTEVGGRSISGWVIAGIALVIVALAAVIAVVMIWKRSEALRGGSGHTAHGCYAVIVPIDRDVQSARGRASIG